MLITPANQAADDNTQVTLEHADSFVPTQIGGLPNLEPAGIMHVGSGEVDSAFTGSR